MEDWEIVVLTTVLSTVFSIMSSIITAKVTTKINYDNDVRKEIREKRAELYFSFYDQVEEVLKKRIYIFDRKYFESLISVKPQIKLLASQKTFEAFRNYYEFVRGQVLSFEKFCNKYNPENDPNRYEICTDDNGEEFEIDHMSPEKIEEFERLKRQYQKEYKPDTDTITAYIEALYQSMREDLGSNI